MLRTKVPSAIPITVDMLDHAQVMTPIVVAWSGGKDSSILVQRLKAGGEYAIAALLTTVTDEYDRISMHGVRRGILHAQARALGFPLIEAPIPSAASNAVYEASFLGALTRLRATSPALKTIAFGDLFLDDVRKYREALLRDHGWEPVFPLWGDDTTALARRFVADGFRARLCCVDTQQLDPAYAGKSFDDALLDSLPSSVDPCGERGEFHTCVYDGPIFAAPLQIEVGERVRREARFEYCDLLLREQR